MVLDTALLFWAALVLSSTVLVRLSRLDETERGCWCWSALITLDGWRGTTTVSTGLLVRSSFFAASPSPDTRMIEGALKLFKRLFELNNNSVKRREVAADIAIHVNHVPRRNDQVIEVGECGLDDVVEEIHLDLRWNSVESFTLDVVGNRLQTHPLALVRDVPGNFCALTRASACSMLGAIELCIESMTYLERSRPVPSAAR